MLYRQGDILIRRVDEVPSKGVKPYTRKRGERLIIAEGEVTGHHHAIADQKVELFVNDAKEAAFVRVLDEAGASLTHDEHDTIVLPEGTYEVMRQREYFPQEIRRVAD